MPSRRGLDDVAQALRRTPGHRTIPRENDGRVARRALDCEDLLRVNEIASTDCAERVADVLNRLGYGFNVIPRCRSAPKRA